MTREEAIERFENVKANALAQKASGVSEYWQNEIDGTIEALDMAIEALSQVRCNDCKWNDDVIEVVRCKDCRWFKQDSSPVGYGYCDGRMVGREVDYSDYCSYGERREE